MGSVLCSEHAMLPTALHTETLRAGRCRTRQLYMAV